MKKLYRWMALLLIAAQAAALLGCYGTFPLTRLVYRVNGSIGGSGSPAGRLVQTAVFWLFVIFPVYGFASLGDAVIMNVIEFWSGQPIATSWVNEQNGARLALTGGVG